MISFEALLGLAAHYEPASYWTSSNETILARVLKGSGRAPRRRKTATGMRQDGAPSAQSISRDQPIKPAQPLHIDEPEFERI